MIKAKVVSFSLSRTNGSMSKLELETYLEDPVDINSFCVGIDFNGLDAVIMTKEEYEAMDSARHVLYKSLINEREKTKELKEVNEAIQKAIKDLEEKIEQKADEIDLHPDGTIIFRKKRVSELEKEVERLKEENKALKEDKFTMKITGGLFYQKED